MNYHSVPIEMAIIKKINNISVCKAMEKVELSYVPGGNIKWQVTL